MWAGMTAVWIFGKRGWWPLAALETDTRRARIPVLSLITST